MPDLHILSSSATAHSQRRRTVAIVRNVDRVSSSTGLDQEQHDLLVCVKAVILCYIKIPMP